jgi:hypothetical protein
MNDGAEVIVCQGPPRCALEGDEAVAAADAGCVWCKRILIAPDGSERTIEPGTA